MDFPDAEGTDNEEIEPKLEAFPEEILAAIWDFLPTPDLLASRLVCKRWATLITFPCWSPFAPNSANFAPHVMFRKIGTLRWPVSANFGVDDLPTHSETGETIPAYVRRLEIGGRSEEITSSAQGVMERFSGQLQELVITDTALAWIDYEQVETWEFQNLRSLEVKVSPAPSSCWMESTTAQQYESHMDALEELFQKDYPKLQRISAEFEATNKWQHAHYNNVLLPSCLQEFHTLLVRCAATIMKLELKETWCGRQILERLNRDAGGGLEVVNCSLDMDAIKNYGVPPFPEGFSDAEGSYQLRLFEEWVRAIPEDDLEYMNYTLEYKLAARGAGAPELGFVPVDLRITVRPVYNVRHLMLAH